MAKRANGVCEFVRVGTIMQWVYGGNVANVEYDLASNPDYATMSAFSQSVYANGAKQKIADAMAGIEGVAAKAESAREVAANLTSLTYTGERIDMLFEAVCAAFPATPPATHRNTLDGLSKADRRMLQNDPTIIAMVNKLTLERAKRSGISAATVLERFG